MLICRNPWDNIILSSTLLLKKYLASFARFSLVVSRMEGIFFNECCSIECCFQDLLKTARYVLMFSQQTFSTKCFIKVQTLEPQCNTEMATAWMYFRFLLSVFNQASLYRSPSRNHLYFLEVLSIVSGTILIILSLLKIFGCSGSEFSQLWTLMYWVHRYIWDSCDC